MHDSPQKPFRIVGYQAARLTPPNGPLPPQARPPTKSSHLSSRRLKTRKRRRFPPLPGPPHGLVLPRSTSAGLPRSGSEPAALRFRNPTLFCQTTPRPAVSLYDGHSRSRPEPVLPAADRWPPPPTARAGVDWPTDVARRPAIRHTPPDRRSCPRAERPGSHRGRSNPASPTGVPTGSRTGAADLPRWPPRPPSKS